MAGCTWGQLLVSRYTTFHLLGVWGRERKRRVFICVVVITVFFTLCFVIPRGRSTVPYILFILTVTMVSCFIRPNRASSLTHCFCVVDRVRGTKCRNFHRVLRDGCFSFKDFPIYNCCFCFVDVLGGPRFLPFFAVLVYCKYVVLIVRGTSIGFGISGFCAVLTLVFTVSAC